MGVLLSSDSEQTLQLVRGSQIFIASDALDRDFSPLTFTKDSQNSLIEPLKVAFLFSALAPHSALRTQGASHFPVPLIPLEPRRRPRLLRRHESLNSFTKACAQGRARLVEYCHYCFHAAGSFQPHNDDTSQCSSGTTAWEIAPVLYCVQRVPAHLTPSPHCLSYLCLCFRLYALFSWVYSARLYHDLMTGEPHYLHLKCPCYSFFHLPS